MKWRRQMLVFVYVLLGLLSACAGKCELGWVAHGDSCYFLSNTGALSHYNWHQARQYCHDQGGELASLHSHEELFLVVEMAQKSQYTGHVWTGMNQLKDRDGDFEWSDSSEVEFEAWAPDQPESSGLKQCVFMCTQHKFSDGLWYSANCGEKKAFVCKKPVDSKGPVTVPPTPEVPGYCPKGYWGYGNKCYKLTTIEIKQGVSWSQALQICRSETGGDLASITSWEEHAAVVSQMTQKFNGYWIGYYREPGNDFLWTDNSDPTFSNWDESEPAVDHCTEISPKRPSIAKGDWKTANCDNDFKMGYICQVYKDPVHIQSTPGIELPHTCPKGFTAYWYGCYELVTAPQTWSSAERYCGDLGGHLASVHDEAENAFLYASSTMQEHVPLWIGLEKVDNEYRWSDGWPDIYSNWDTNEPSGGEGCVAMKTTGHWYDAKCSHEYPFMCKFSTVPVPTTPLPRDGLCPSSEWEEFGSHCFYFGKIANPRELFSWPEAEEFCQKLGGSTHNAHLASIHDHVTNYWVYKHATFRSMWIGMSREDFSAPWTWSDGSPVSYANWVPGEPDNGTEPGKQLCVVQNTNKWLGLWNDKTCSFLRAPVCKAEKVVTYEKVVVPMIIEDKPVAIVVDDAPSVMKGRAAGIVAGIMAITVIIGAIAFLILKRQSNRASVNVDNPAFG